MTVDVVVVGAGIAGSALAYYLSSGGAQVTILDRAFPGQGATGRSAGLLTVQLWNELDVSLARAAQDISSELLGEGRGGFERVGFLRVTRQEADVPAMRENLETYKTRGIDVELLQGEELADHFPLLATEGLAAGLYTPDDGFVDPHDLASVFINESREEGAVVRSETRVDAVHPTSGGVALETSGGPLNADLVVVAAGAWSAALLRRSGIHAHLKSYRTQALVTAPLESAPSLPMLHELPEGFYFRPDQAGLLLGDGTEEREVDPSGYNTQADFELYSEIARWISRRVPSLSTVGFARGWAGLCVGTPDRLPLVGRVGEGEGLYLFAGFNGMGIMRAPALAEALAEALLGGSPSLDLSPLSPDRFVDLEDFTIREGFTLR